MDRKKPQSIGDIMRRLFQENNMQGFLDECKAAELWPQVVGGFIASSCRKPFVRNGVMTVGVADSALRHELIMCRTSIRKSINELIKKEIISEIRFTS